MSTHQQVWQVFKEGVFAKMVRARELSRFGVEIVLSLQAHILFSVTLGIVIMGFVLNPFVTLSIVVLVSLIIILHVYISSDVLYAYRSDHSFRVMILNVLRDNTEYELVAQAIQRENPDILALVEYTDKWRAGLEGTEVLAEYRFCHHHLFIHGKHEDGIAIYSKEEFVVREESPDGAFLVCESERFDFIVTHLHNPIVSRDSFLQRNEQMDAIACIAQHAMRPFAVFGDFNATPHSLDFRSFVKKSKLARAGGGQYLLSWTPIVRSWANIGGLSLDHFLYNEHIVVEKIRIGSFVASDHRPIIVDFHE